MVRLRRLASRHLAVLSLLGEVRKGGLVAEFLRVDARRLYSEEAFPVGSVRLKKRKYGNWDNINSDTGVT